MSHILRELKVVKKQDDKAKEPRREFIRAVIVRHEGNLRVPNHPEKVYTSELGLSASLIPAINFAVPDIEGLPVILGWLTRFDVDERIIISMDASVPTDGPLGNYSVPAHADTHEWFNEAAPGSDAIRIFQSAWMPLKTLVSATSLTITVRALRYTSGLRTVYFPGQQVDLTSYLPGAGNTKYVLIYLDKNSNTAKVTSGAEVPIGLIPQKPDMPNRYAEPSALIQLSAGQTGINVATQYIDVRSPFGADSSTAIPATEIGQVLYSTNGLDLEAKLPVVDDAGIIVTNNAGKIVVI